MSVIRSAGALLVVVALAACGDDGQDGEGSSGNPPAAEAGGAEGGTTAPSTAAPGSDDGSQGAGEELDPGAYPNEPAFSEDLRTCPDWAPPSTCADGTFTFAASDGISLVPFPVDVEPGNRGTLLELAVSSIEGDGEVGLVCRSSFTEPLTGYALTGNHDRGWTLWRFEDGEREVVENPMGLPSEDLGAGSDGRVVLRLGCGWGTGPGGQVSLLYAVDSQPVGPVTPSADEPGLDVDGERSQVGVVVLPDEGGTVDVELEQATLRLAE